MWKMSKGMVCRKCGKKGVEYRVWTSSDGGWEDINYRCLHCDYAWWVDGSDY